MINGKEVDRVMAKQSNVMQPLLDMSSDQATNIFSGFQQSQNQDTSMKINRVCLDHNHEIGKVRGYLRGDCNASIGRMGESVSILQRAILWLKGQLRN